MWPHPRHLVGPVTHQNRLLAIVMLDNISQTFMHHDPFTDRLLEINKTQHNRNLRMSQKIFGVKSELLICHIWKFKTGPKTITLDKIPIKVVQYYLELIIDPFLRKVIRDKNHYRVQLPHDHLQINELEQKLLKLMDLHQQKKCL